MKVAVTGCNGYIGSILTEILIERGYDVYGCDWSDSSMPTNPKLINFWNGDFSNPTFIKLIADAGVKTIFHMAATSLVGPSYLDPIDYYHNNTGRVTALLHYLKLLKWSGHIVFASSAAVYGDDEKQNGFTENDQTNPVNHYGQSKLFTEKILNSAKVHDIFSTSFRFFNVVGAYKDLGEEYNDTHLISRLCYSAFTGKPFHVLGNDYNTQDGTCIRDYVHVLDICEAMILSAERNNNRTDTYNLGTSVGTSVLEMVEAFKLYTGEEMPVIISERRIGDPACLIANSEKFACLNEFLYTNSTLKNMIVSSWEHYKSRGELDGI